MSDIVAALGPGKKLDSLTTSAPHYVTVRRALHDLLVFPHLEAIQIEGTSKSDLVSLVTEGYSRFSELSTIDLALARKVITYDASFSELVGAVKIKLLVMTLQPAAQEFADHARAHSKANLKFFANFTHYVASVDARIISLDAALAQLNAQIQAQSDALASKNIVTTLWKALKTLYKLVSNAEDSDVQIAAILGVTITTIGGSFNTLFNDRVRLQKIVASLKGLRTRTQDLKARLVVLNTGLKSVSIGSQNFLDVWDDIAARMGPVAENMHSVPAHEAKQLKKAWSKVATGAKDYIDIFQRSTSDHPGATRRAIESYRILTAKFNAFPKVPITPAEIHLHKLAAVHGHDVRYATHWSGINPVASDNEKVVETVLGPPVETQKRLEDLADSTGRVIDQFDTLLRQPFLDQYKCTSPIDASDSNLYTVMNYYRNEYLQLQQDTLPVARDLNSYGALQTALLPTVVPDAEAKETDLSMSAFLNTNAPFVTKYKEKASVLSDRSTKVKNDWDNVVNLIHKLIAECDSNIKKFKDSIADLTEQQKNMTLWACLAAFGAFIAFTASAFLPPAGVLLGLAGTALGGFSVYKIIASAQMTVAINDLKTALANEENTRAHLESLLPYAIIVSKSLSSISLIWSDITTALTTLDMFYDVLNGENGPEVLDNLRPQIINKWVAVQDAVAKYIEVVAE